MSKHVPLFEEHVTKTLDDILDKINKSGMDSLSDIEKEYLMAYDTNKALDLEQRIQNASGVKTIDKIKPEDLEKYKSGSKSYIDPMSMDDDQYKEHLEEGGLKELWQTLNLNIIENFLEVTNRPLDMAKLNWEDLPEEMRGSFKIFVDKNKLGSEND